jgi:hypothetical protein
MTFLDKTNHRSIYDDLHLHNPIFITSSTLEVMLMVELNVVGLKIAHRHGHWINMPHGAIFVFVFKMHFLILRSVDVFCTGKIKGGQDSVFQFWCYRVNNEAHSDLSWFKPLLKGNRPTFSGLILKMSRCYMGWAECLRSSRERGNGSRTP